MKRLLLVGVLLAVAGCPDNPYKASTWTKKLKDPREAERAITELEQLGDPSAIPALGEAWVEEGKPPRYLQVIIALAHPLTPKEAEARFFTDFQESGRKPSWDTALPFLKQAITEVDETNPRSVESAQKAAEALGEAKLAEAIEPLGELAKKPITKKLVTAQAAAAKALGQFDNDKAKAAALLADIIAKEPPDDPKKAKDKAEGRLMTEKLELHLLVTNAALGALGDLRAPTSAKPLALAMYRTPALFANTRRAIVAAGPQGEEEMLKILRNQETDVNQFIKDKRLDVYCGEDGKLTPCLPLGAKDFYPAVVIGDFYDPKVVPDLLTALKRPVAPQYYQDADSPSDSTNYSAILDALRKIGAPEAAPAVRAIWEGTAQAKPEAPAAPPPKKGAPAPKPADKPAEGAPGDLDIRTRTFAITVYPFVARDSGAASDLAKIADGKLTQPSGVDLQQWNAFRQEAATAFARLSINPADIDVLQRMAQVQFDAGKKEEDKAKAEKPKFDAAETALKAAQKAEVDAQKASMSAAGDKNKSVEEIRAAADAANKAKDAAKEQKKKHKVDTAAYNQATANARNLKGFGHIFQMHSARIVVAMRCKKDISCFVKTLSMKPEDAIKDVQPYIKDADTWTKEEKQGLVDGEVERAMLELGKLGAGAASETDKLLDAAKSDDHLIRQSILIALPKIAKIPCSNCEQKLDAALRAGEGKSGIQDLQLETQMLRNYFAWAGGRTPTAQAEKPEGEAPASDAKPAEK